MNRSHGLKTPGKGRYRVGDRARLKHIWPDAVVEIVEDRGCIGHQGDQYYHIRVMRPLLEDGFMDWPEDELLPLDTEPENRTATSPSVAK